MPLESENKQCKESGRNVSDQEITDWLPALSSLFPTTVLLQFLTCNSCDEICCSFQVQLAFQDQWNTRKTLALQRQAIPVC